MPTENRSSNTDAPFMREDRYIVIKRSDLKKVSVNYRSALIDPMLSLLSHLPRRECLVIESDWPEFERTWAAIEARVTGRPVEQNKGGPVAWSSEKPTSPGAYWIRGNGLGRPALIEVTHEYGELRCNLHDRTTCDDFGFGYSIESLNEEFEFSGPLYTYTDPAEVGRLRAEIEEIRDLAERQSRLLTETAIQLRGPEPELQRHGHADIPSRVKTVVQLLREARGFCNWPRHPLPEKIDAALSASAEPSKIGNPELSDSAAPAASIPEGYCLMPRRLTAENGAKALLLGEFKLNVVRECPECHDLEEPVEGCEICDGEGEYAQHHTIPWNQIKFIYSEAVKGLAIQPDTVRELRSVGATDGQA